MSQITKKNTRRLSGGDAVFLGYQKTKDGNAIPLYNITVRHHPLRGSTVTERSLRALDLQVPEIPLKNKKAK
jgi:hypothetical protein